MSDFHLTAAQDFAEFKRGEKIDDPDRVNQILASEHASHVRQVHPTKLKATRIDTGKVEAAAEPKLIEVEVPPELIKAAEDAAKQRTVEKSQEGDGEEKEGEDAEHPHSPPVAGPPPLEPASTR